MSSEDTKPKFNPGEEKTNCLDAREIGSLARKVALALPDDSLTQLGYARGDKVEILLGELRHGDLAALLTVGGLWLVGFVFFERAAYVVTTCAGLSQCPLGRGHVRDGGRVVRHNGSRVIQAGVMLPPEDVGRVRFRFRV